LVISDSALTLGIKKNCCDKYLSDFSSLGPGIPQSYLGIYNKQEQYLNPQTLNLSFPHSQIDTEMIMNMYRYGTIKIDDASKWIYGQLLSILVVFNLFHKATYFSTQLNLTTLYQRFHKLLPYRGGKVCAPP